MTVFTQPKPSDPLDAIATGTARLVADIAAGTTLAGLPFDGQSQPITVLPGATVIATGDVTTSELAVNAGGTFRMAESGTALLDAGGLTLADPDAAGDNGGVIDLSDNDMIARQTPDSEIEAYLTAGYDGGLWDGQPNATGPQPAAILSSAAAAEPYFEHGVGYEEVGASTGEWPAANAFDGTAVSAGDTVVKFTLNGDANLDGTVDSSDYSAVENGYTHGLTGWGNGDFNFSGVVTGVDLTVVDDALLVLDDHSVKISGTFTNNKDTVTVTAGQQTQINITATDVNGDNVAISGMNISSATLDGTALTGSDPFGFTVGTPSQNTSGVNQITLTVPTAPGKYVLKVTAPNATNSITVTVIVQHA